MNIRDEYQWRTLHALRVEPPTAAERHRLAWLAARAEERRGRLRAAVAALGALLIRAGERLQRAAGTAPVPDADRALATVQ